MADIYTNLSGTAQVDNSVIEAFSQQFIIAAAQEGVMDQFVTVKESIGAKSIEFTKYSQLALATTALNEREELTSEAMADSAIILTPAEYGNVVTKTTLASLQSGGKVDAAAAKLVGLNMGRTLDKLAVLAGEAATNTLTPDGSAEASLEADDIMSATFLNKLYNKLARASVAPLADGMYVAVLHDDVIHDLRNSTGAGSWQDIAKYGSPEVVFKNEVGMLGGFRIIRNNHCTVTADAGALAVDTYRGLFLGFNAIGKAVSAPEQMVITGPFDKLARFVHVGWKSCLQYKIVDSDAIYMGITASSVGSNA